MNTLILSLPTSSHSLTGRRMFNGLLRRNIVSTITRLTHNVTISTSSICTTKNPIHMSSTHYLHAQASKSKTHQTKTSAMKTSSSPLSSISSSTSSSRSTSTSTSITSLKSTPAVAFDVDGVLLRGPIALPGAKKALELLKLNNIPFILLTNGGGSLEVDKAKQISTILDFEISPQQLQLAHTPFKSLVSTYENKPVLLVGKSKIHQIAHSYGFKNTFDIGDMHHQFPAMFPDWKPIPKKDEVLQGNIEYRDTQIPRRLDINERIECILVFMDPLHYHRDIQIVVDFARSNGQPGTSYEGIDVDEDVDSKNGTLDGEGGCVVLREEIARETQSKAVAEVDDGDEFEVVFPGMIAIPIVKKAKVQENPDVTTIPNITNIISDKNSSSVVTKKSKQFVKIYMAGPDFEYVTDFPVPRFGAGIFGMTTEYLYERSTNKKMEYTFYGKPTVETYDYATGVLSQQASDVNQNISKIYMVGDNPLSDIQGANNAGWTSILVRTGMFTSTAPNDSINPASHVVNNVSDAVDLIIQQYKADLELQTQAERDVETKVKAVLHSNTRNKNKGNKDQYIEKDIKTQSISIQQ